jgi:hypothetical protein
MKMGIQHKASVNTIKKNLLARIISFLTWFRISVAVMVLWWTL